MSATNYSTKFLSVIVASSTKKSAFRNGIVSINNRSFTTTTKTKTTLSKTTTTTLSTPILCTGTSDIVGFVSSKSSVGVVPVRTFYTKKGEDDKASNEQEQEPYTSLTYPFATEPPEIYVTNAKDLKNPSITSRTEPYTPPPIKHLNSSTSSSTGSSSDFSSISSIFSSFTGVTNNNDTSSSSVSSTTDGTNSIIGTTLQERLLDPFDDQLTIKDEDVLQILKEQKQSIVTKPPNTTPISLTVPDNIPKLLPASQLDIPQTQVTTLDNGVRIVSFDSYGSQVSVVGIVAELGSRTENTTNRGVTNVLEMLTCQSSTRSYTGQDITDLIQDLGGSNRCSVLGKEQSIIFFDCLRNNLTNAVTILNEVIIHPKFIEDEVNDAKISLQYNLETLPNDCLLGEGLLQAAYNSTSQMGQNHVIGGSNENLQLLQQISSTTCIDYWNNQLLTNPYNIVIGGIGVNHEQFVHMIQTQTDFPKLKNNDTNDKRSKIIQSTYIGGDYRYEVPDPAELLQQQLQSDESVLRESMPITETIEEQNMVKVAVGFEVGGWILPDSNYYNTDTNFGSHGKIIQNNDDLVTLCVLQTLLGGGSSFSVGGPGKGMYSRLYREILNKYNWVDNAECYTSVYNTNGLFGISGTVTHPNYAGDMIMVIVDHILQLTSVHVTEDELYRAKNMLKNSVLSSLESRFILFEDISKQMLMYGRHDNIQDTIQKIHNVTPEDIRQLVIKSITINSNNRPTVASVGRDISSVPQYDIILSWFSNVKK